MSICLTASQKESFDFIQKYYKKNDKLPTMSEIAAEANCTVPGIAYRVAAAFLKGAYGHNTSSRLHNIVEAQPLVKPEIMFSVDWSDCPFVLDKDLLSRIVFRYINDPSAAHHMNTLPYTPFEMVYSKSGKRGPLYRWLTDAAKGKAWSRDIKPVEYVFDVIFDMITEGKISPSDKGSDDADAFYVADWFSYEHETEEQHLAAEKAEYDAKEAQLAEQARIETERVAEEAAKQHDTNAALAKAFVALLSDPAIGKIVSSITGFNAQ